MNGNGGQEEYDDDGTVVADKGSEKERDREDKSQGHGTPGKTESPLNTPSQVRHLQSYVFTSLIKLHYIWQEPTPVPASEAPSRGSFRGRAAAARARGFAARGRGRGGFHADCGLSNVHISTDTKAYIPQLPLAPPLLSHRTSPPAHATQTPALTKTKTEMETAKSMDLIMAATESVANLKTGDAIETVTATAIETASGTIVIETATVSEIGSTGKGIGRESGRGNQRIETVTATEGRARMPGRGTRQALGGMCSPTPLCHATINIYYYVGNALTRARATKEVEDRNGARIHQLIYARILRCDSFERYCTVLLFYFISMFPGWVAGVTAYALALGQLHDWLEFTRQSFQIQGPSIKIAPFLGCVSFRSIRELPKRGPWNGWYSAPPRVRFF